MRTIELRMDSATVHRWIDDALSGSARLRTKAHGETLIRRRVVVIRQLVTELVLYTYEMRDCVRPTQEQRAVDTTPQ